MKILVCISKTPETTAKIAFQDDNSKFATDGVQYIMNPYDEWYGLVRAIELKEQQGGEVTVINVGDVSNDPILRKALAIGADKAVRIDAEAESSLQVANEIANYAKTGSFDMIFLGKETIDYNGAELGGMVAELLDLPYFSFASKLEMEGNAATVTRDIEGGVEVAKANAPMVISAAKGLAEQRIPNMMGIMQSKRKPLDVVPASFGESLAKVTKYQLPEEKKGVQMIDPENMDELVRLLHQEAKVI